MPAIAGPLMGFILGNGFAWFSRAEIAKSPNGFALHGMIVAGMFGLLVHTPVAAFFLGIAPDWCFAYLVDTLKLPPLVLYLLVLLNALSVPLGFFLGQAPARTAKPAAALRIVTLPALLVAGSLTATLKRLAVSASYAQFHGDFGTTSVAGSSLGYALLWMASVFVMGILWTGHNLRRIHHGDLQA